ncbi:TPA: mucoidy inhibitor MuiA family protein [Providencia alcalifaciens]|nr:mucoidy inhibitor MuiA family protein [Providencia alcalifaciens]
MFVTRKFTKGILFVSALASWQAFAESAPLLHPLKLNQATIFLRGAELTNSATVNLPQGESKLVFTNVADHLDQKSLSISLDNEDVLIRSIDVQTVAVEPVYTEEAASLKAQIDGITKQISELNIKIKVGDDQLALLKDQRFFGETTTLSLEQSASKLEFIRKQMSAILSENLAYQQQIDELTEKQALLQAKFDGVLPDNIGEQTQIVLTVDTPKNLSTNMQISYVTPDAGWSPSYDIRAKDIDKPVNITYKADVIQNTGLDWNKVKLTLSSANPTRNITPPFLTPWLLSVYDQYNQGYMSGKMSATMDMEVAAPAPVAELSAVKKRSPGMANYVATNTNGVNLSYNIELPFSLASTPKAKSITIKQADIDAKYRYTSTPKMAEEVYLQAQIDDWDTLNLLNGPANIYFMNSYVGDFYVNSGQLTETLDIPFGVDDNIQISRVNNAAMRKKPSFMGSTVEQKESFLIKVRNTRKNDIKLSVYDQLPTSRDTDIKVLNPEYKGGKLDETENKIEWDLTLKPQEAVELPLSYTLKYPKNKQINGL